MNVTLKIDTDRLSDINDTYLAAYWHAVQAAPGAFGVYELEMGAEQIGREIIRRWLASVSPALWTRQGRHIEAAPAIDRIAKTQNVVTAAREVVACDHGSNLATDRERCVQAVADLESAVRQVRA